jgi:hypothetical protein
MEGNMYDNDRPFRADGVKLLPGEVALFRQARVIIAITHYPTFGIPPGPVTERLEYACDIPTLNAAGSPVHGIAEKGKVAMRIDEAGVDYTSPKLDHLMRGRTNTAHDVIESAKAIDTPIDHAQAFGFGHALIKGDETRTGIDGPFPFKHG